LKIFLEKIHFILFSYNLINTNYEEVFMRKIISCFLFFSFIFAEDSFLDIPSSEPENNIDIQTEKNTSFTAYDRELIEDTVARYVNDMMHQKKKPRYQRQPGSFTLPLKKGHVYIEGEYLFWKPYAVIPYAIRKQTFPLSNGNFDNFQVSRVADVSLKANSGYRAKLGFYLPSPTWYLDVEYTQLYAQGVDSVDSQGRGSATAFSPVEELVDIQVPWAAYAPATDSNGPYEVNAKQRMGIKIIDADLAKTFITRSCFTFDPFISFRYARITLGTRIDFKEFQDDNLVSGAFPPYGTNHIDLNNNFLGYGLRAGFKLNWALGNSGFEVFGKGAFSSLVGTFYLRNRNDLNRATNDPAQVNGTSTAAYKFADMQNSFQLVLGLLWGATFYHKCYLGIKAGYEMNTWPEFIKSLNFDTTNAEIYGGYVAWNRKLAMQGLIASIKLDF